MTAFIPISLGCGCLIKHQLQSNGYESATLPFDWISTPYFASILSLFENDFKDFIKIEDMGVKEEKDIIYLFNLKLNISFPHDIDIKEWQNQLPALKCRYERRINRFKLLLKGSQPLLFIRFVGNDEIINSTDGKCPSWGIGFKLVELIEKKYPNLNFNFVLLVKGDKVDKFYEQEKFFSYTIPYSPTWKGDTFGWAQFLSKYTFIPYGSNIIKCL